MIPENIPINTYNGDNSTILFKFNFLINKEEEILVTYVDKNDNKILLELNKDYSVKEIGKIDGSYVKFPLEGSTYTTLKEDEKIILELNLPIVQNKLFSQEIPFDLSSLEYSLDYLTRLIQILQSKIDSYTVNNSEVLNNPYSLFDSKYSETPLYNASWLLSNSNFYSKSIYITAYEALVVEQNKEIKIGSVEQLPSGTNYIKRGLSVKLSTDDFTDYDFVLNKDEETFRLPLLNGEESISGTSNIPVTVSLSGTQYTVPSNGIITAVFSARTYGGWIQFENLTNQEVSVIRICESGSNWVFSNNMFAKRGDIINITYDGVLTANYNFYPYVGNGNLYYYIADSVQNINLLDVGTVLEQLNSSKRGYLVESYSEEKAGYRVYSDGYCEQWGYTPSVSVGATYTVNLYKNYKDSNYNISYSELAPANTQGGYAQSNNMCITPVNSNTFILWSGNTNPIYFYWKTSGWLA